MEIGVVGIFTLSLIQKPFVPSLVEMSLDNGVLAGYILLPTTGVPILIELGVVLTEIVAEADGIALVEIPRLQLVGADTGVVECHAERAEEETDHDEEENEQPALVLEVQERLVETTAVLLTDLRLHRRRHTTEDGIDLRLDVLQHLAVFLPSGLVTDVDDRTVGIGERVTKTCGDTGEVVHRMGESAHRIGELAGGFRADGLC